MAAGKLQRALYAFPHDAADRRNAATFIKLINQILAEEVEEWRIMRHAG